MAGVARVLRDMKASATSDLTVGGPHLAAHALKSGLVDECHLFIRPVSSAEASPLCRSTLAPTSNCWTIADSATVSCTSATASRPERPRPPTSKGTRSASLAIRMRSRRNRHLRARRGKSKRVEAITKADEKAYQTTTKVGVH